MESITVDSSLLKQADILTFEQVHVLNTTNASGDLYQIAGGSTSNWYQGTYTDSSTKKVEDGSEKLKDIVAFLGLKIINVIINEDEIVLTCRRNRKVYKIQIKNSVVTIINDKDKMVRQFDLSLPYSLPSLPYTYPPSIPSTTTPPINFDWYTTDDKTGNIDLFEKFKTYYLAHGDKNL